MQKVLTAAEMREVDRLTTEKYGIPSIILMENAAHAAARVIAEKLGGSVKGKSFLILCGPGNNGGDGAALSRILWNQGAHVSVDMLRSIEKTKGDARTNFEILNKLPDRARGKLDGIFTYDLSQSKHWQERYYYELYHWDVFVDAVFGTGLTGPISDDDLASVLNSIHMIASCHQQKPYIVSLDIPSGIASDLPSHSGKHLQADLTIAFTSPKPGNVMPPACSYNGELAIVNIGSPKDLIDNSPSQLYLAEKHDAQNWFKETVFSNDSYKNKRGHSLIIAGSENYTGAAVLTADACMRSGVGLVTLATPKSVKDSIAARVLPEIMTMSLAETESGAVSEDALTQIEELIHKIHCVAIGSGLSSNEETTRKFVRKVVENRKTPILVDADALNALSPFDIKGDDKHPIILTPHKGEMKRLLGLKDQDDIGDLVALAREFAQKHHVILVLKGERALIAEPGGKVVINPTGNSGLGKGGNGDTLAGIITGFVTQAHSILAKGKEDSMELIFDAVVVAVYTAGLAGDIAENKYGKRVMTASDVRECLVDAFKEIESSNE